MTGVLLPGMGATLSADDAGATSEAGASALGMPYFRRKRSTRPAVSTIFCLPVKNGWQALQISMLIEALVDSVVKAAPQTQVTAHST